MKQFLYIGLVLSVLTSVFSQNVGVGTLNPHPSAQLEMRSTNQGLLIPRLTTVQRDGISKPAHSLLIFNIDNFCLEAYDSLQGEWFAVSCPSTCNPCDTCPLPVIDSIVGLGSICPNDTLTYIIYGSGGLPVWVTPSSWVLLTPSDTARFISGNLGVLYGSLCNECGCVYDSIVLNMGSAPASVSIIGPQTSCVLDTLVLSASSPGFASYYSWQLPAGWTPLSPTNSASLITIPPSLGTFSVSVQACNGCGCSPPTTHTVNIINNPLNPSVAISGPSFVCLPDTIVLKAPHPTANSWTWFYPPSWQLISQGGDSIVLAPDSMNGNVIVKVCDTTSSCTCDIDTLLVNTDTCRTFCAAVGGSNYDVGWSVVQTSDGGFAIAGTTLSFGAGSGDVYVVKIDANGNLQWTKTIGGTSWDAGHSIIQTIDGGFAIAGSTMSFGVGSYDVYVIKLDANGNLQWTKTIGGTNSEEGRAIIQDSDGNLYTTGYTRSYGVGNADVYVIKLDSLGNLQWAKTIGGTNADEGRDIIQTADGGFAIVGYTGSFGIGGNGDVYVVKLDNNGDLQWTKTIGGASLTADDAYSITQTSDKGYAITGHTSSFGAGMGDAYIIKLDSLGNLQWTKTVGGANADWGYSIQESDDGGLIVAGETGSFGSGGLDMYILKLNSNGSLQWTRTIGGTSNESGVSLVKTIDGNFLVIGYTDSFGNGNRDIYIVKLDANGNLLNCNAGCQVSTGGSMNSGGLVSTGGSLSSAMGNVRAGGSTNSGGTLVNICP